MPQLEHDFDILNFWGQSCYVNIVNEGNKFYQFCKENIKKKIVHNDKHDTPQKRTCTNVRATNVFYGVASFNLYISMEKLEKEFLKSSIQFYVIVASSDYCVVRSCHRR